jgi:hypothetical protein
MSWSILAGVDYVKKYPATIGSADSEELLDVIWV